MKHILEMKPTEIKMEIPDAEYEEEDIDILENVRMLYFHK